MTGLSLLTPPHDCDPDTRATYARALDHTETALRHTPECAASIRSAATPDALAAAVLRALIEHEKCLRYTANCAQDHATKVTHELDAEAVELNQRSFRRAMETVRLHAVTPTVHALATQAPATAGALHVDGDGREVTP